MRLLVTHNWFLANDPYAAAEGKPYPPLGTAIVAAMLRDRGHDVVLHDATFADPAAFPALLDAVAPERLLLVSDHFLVPQKMCLDAHRREGFAMLGAAASRGIPAFASGPDVSDRPADYLIAGATIAVRGEPDAAACAWADGVDPADIPGAVTDPAAPTCAPAAPIRDLAPIPGPAWERLDLDPYRRTWERHHGVWEAPVTAARGCPYRCNWCAKPIWGRTQTQRPVAAVVAEARDLGARGAGRIWFADDIFGLKASWLRAFREEVRAQGGIPPFRCLSRADLLVRNDTVALLAEAGCVEVWLGAESGSQRVLDAMEKDQDVAEIDAAVHLLRAHGLRVGLFLQFGYPGETIEDVRATFAMIRRLRPDEIGISVSLPLPGTPFYESVKHRMSAPSWSTTMDNALLYEATYPQPFYDAAREALRREHAVWMGVEAAGRLVRGVRGAKGRRNDLRRTALIGWHALRLPIEHAKVQFWSSTGGSVSRFAGTTTTESRSHGEVT